MQTVYIDFKVPTGWHELSDKKLRLVYRLLAGNFSTDTIKTLCFLKWSKTKVIGRQNNGKFLLKKGKDLFEVTPIALAEVMTFLDWLGSLPNRPVRISTINRRKALPAEFFDVPFETFIICDNLYQGYLKTQNDELLDEMGAVLYGKEMEFKPFERINIFYWFASLKDWLSRKYSFFFQPMEGVNDENLLGAPSMSVEDAMNAQIRALTKGDVTKEAEVLALDTHRALTELNAQAREYKEMNEKLNMK